MPTITDEEYKKKLSEALSSLYKAAYFYFKGSSASVETQSRRAVVICRLLDAIKTEFSSLVATVDTSPGNEG